MSITLSALQQQRRDTAANWTSANPTLLAAEWGYETDTGKWKVGDGSTAWTSLAYVGIADASGNLGGDITIGGNLTVEGTTTTIESTVVTIEDKNIQLATVDTPTDTTADGGGFTIKGTTDKTFNWVNSTNCFTSSERLDLPAGTEALPALIFNGETDSGIYKPAADELGFCTSGDEKLRIDSSGNVGIGTNSPSSLLQINKLDATVYDEDATDSQVGVGPTIYLNNPANANNTVGGQIVFSMRSTEEQARIGATGGVNPALTFGTNDAEQMRIDSSGNVGIGTTSPAEKLHVVGDVRIVDNSPRLGFHDANASAIGDATGGVEIFNSSGSRSCFLGATEAAGVLSFGTNNSERMRIDSSGDVGIGTTSPDAKLEVVATSTGKVEIARFRIEGQTNNPMLRFFSDEANQVLSIETSGSTAGTEMAFEVNGSERMRIDSSGRVGIGTSSPGSILHTAANDPEIRIQDLNSATANSSDARVSFYHSGGTKTAEIGYTATDDSNSLKFRSTVATGLALGTDNTDALYIDSSQQVGIGTTSPSQKLHVKTSSDDVAKLESTSGGNGPNLTFTHTGASPADEDIISKLTFVATNDNSQETTFADIKIIATDVSDNSEDAAFTFSTRNDGTFAERMRIDSSGNVGIGTTSPGKRLTVFEDDISIQSTSSSLGRNAEFGLLRSDTGSVNGMAAIAMNGTGSNNFLGEIKFYTGASDVFNTTLTERLRIDSSGRLLVGTSNAYATPLSATDKPICQLHFNNPSVSQLMVANWGSGTDTGPSISLCRSDSALGVGSHDALDNNDRLGNVRFNGSDGTEFIEGAKISAEADAAFSTGSSPTRLVFSTTASGASSPTERMRIKNDGIITINTTNNNPPANSVIGTAFRADGSINTAASGGVVMAIGRTASDGNLIQFWESGTVEGSISVSGTTVSYNGGHLSRWSQLASGADRIEILRGSVLSNLDEMCEWGEEDNEQLNRMKVSDVEGDKNVSGVFQAWDDDDDTYTNDFYCAMTGDFVIRIAQGTTVARGDLLMSAGDGTAKPQDDDIVRSKTIAKVTSTTVSETYADGSYCVPCVLMAC